ncbi:MAG: nucleotidyl transferase AbiEii/AbiGii toxin family protein [Deltaproteobacteria bacterium]|nr:nucleotidyl transferase AbiEii/AbiGii toxin family protein [Deltaproteobacteria bacterium]
MVATEKPRLDLAKKVLPRGLLRAFLSVAEKSDSQMMLVGGTALAGFYAGHRRSDDLDLFCASPFSFEATWRAVDLLEQEGAIITSRQSSQTYQRRVVELLDHTFTIDVVLDENLFRVGTRLEVGERLGVASLETLLRMKSATLVSRASEKDMYDLLWLFDHFSDLSLGNFLALGQSIDAGVNPEAILYVLGSTRYTSEACGFAIGDETPAQALKRIRDLQKRLIQEISQLLHESEEHSTLGKLVKVVRKLDK